MVCVEVGDGDLKRPLRICLALGSYVTNTEELLWRRRLIEGRGGLRRRTTCGSGIHEGFSGGGCAHGDQRWGGKRAGLLPHPAARGGHAGRGTPRDRRGVGILSPERHR